MEDQGLPDPWESTGAFEDVVGRYLAVGMDEFVIDQPRAEQFAVLEQVAKRGLARAASSGMIL